jgi:hypothetical protein
VQSENLTFIGWLESPRDYEIYRHYTKCWILDLGSSLDKSLVTCLSGLKTHDLPGIFIFLSENPLDAIKAEPNNDPDD